MLFAETFAGQNWLITPAALAVNETPPKSISGQKWMLQLSGVVLLGLKGSADSWLRETVIISPSLQGPLDYAINRFSIPKPTGEAGSDYNQSFQVEQWAPFAAISSILDQSQSLNAGFAVDLWRPNPFRQDIDSFSNWPINNLFTGIQVDVGVRDFALLYRVSYNISLLGKIVFSPITVS
jgi:hypothetical protein